MRLVTEYIAAGCISYKPDMRRILDERQSLNAKTDIIRNGSQHFWKKYFYKEKETSEKAAINGTSQDVVYKSTKFTRLLSLLTVKTGWRYFRQSRFLLAVNTSMTLLGNGVLHRP